MTLYIILYHHKHGFDTFTVVDSSVTSAVDSIRNKLYEEYDKEEIDGEEDQYGPIECVASFHNGEITHIAGRRYKIEITEVK
jgi:hypothetical protein